MTIRFWYPDDEYRDTLDPFTPVVGDYYVDDVGLWVVTRRTYNARAQVLHINLDTP